MLREEVKSAHFHNRQSLEKSAVVEEAGNGMKKSMLNGMRPSDVFVDQASNVDIHVALSYSPLHVRMTLDSHS